MNTTQAKVAVMPPFLLLNNERFPDKVRVNTAVDIFKKKNKNKWCLRVITYIRSSLPCKNNHLFRHS